MSSVCPAWRPRRHCGGGGNHRTRGAYPRMAPDGHPGHAGDRRGEARGRRLRGACIRARRRASALADGGRGYALEAVEALGLDPARVFKTIVISVDGRLGLAVVPADAEVDLKAAAEALAGATRRRRRARGRGAGDGLRAGRDLPARHPTRRCRRSSTPRRRRLADDPRLGRPARPGDGARAGDPCSRLTRSWRRSRAAERPSTTSRRSPPARSRASAMSRPTTSHAAGHDHREIRVEPLEGRAAAVAERRALPRRRPRPPPRTGTT